jgi:hypothetical protein
MAFVPEGQADSSQARSASGIDVKRLRPGGTVEVIQTLLPAKAVQLSKSLVNPGR